MGVMFANLIPISLDAILAGFTESGARVLAPAYQVTPLNNFWLVFATAIVDGARDLVDGGSRHATARGAVWPSTAIRP